MSIPAASDPQPDSSTWHPEWCDRSLCRYDDPRGPYHVGTPVTFDTGRPGDVKVTAQCYAMSWQPPEETTAAVELTFERTDQTSIEGYQLDAAVYRGLVAALTDDVIAGPMRAEFDREVAEARERLAESGGSSQESASGPGWVGDRP